ncbi:MAG: OmpW family protein [Gammaproteobacteria bacterium]|nr:OmpW family protein [Gammaproteobacteria bacterium]
MKSLITLVGSLTLALGCATTALAVEQGDWLVRGRIINVSPDDSSGPVPGFAGSSVGVDDAWTAEVDFTYMVTNNLGLELILATSEHDVDGSGSISGLGDIIEASVLPPTLTLQYHFTPQAKFRPYAGAGVNYTMFYSEETKGALSGLDVSLENSWGWAAQLGADWDLNSDWFLNVDVKYVDIDTTAKIAGIGNVSVEIDPVIFGIGVGKRF